MGEMRCSTAMIKALEEVGTEAAFVYNGHGNWAFLDSIKYESKIKGFACRGENQAVHMADGYYRARKKGALPIVSTSVGPGNMNIGAALANAFFESSALLVLAGGGSTHWQDRGGIEEFYRYAPDEWIQSVKTYTKKAVMISRPDTAVEMLLRAYKTAVTGRPGPVVLQVPFDIQHSTVESNIISSAKQFVNVHPPGPDVGAVKEAAKLISKSERPLLFVSGGIHHADAFKELALLAETWGLPVATTTMGKGAYPEGKPLCLGAAGRSGTGHANRAAAECDLLISIGTHFSDVDTGGWTLFNIPSKTRLIHIDIDASEIARVYPTEVGVISDARLALNYLIEELRSLDVKDRWASWRNQLNTWRDEWEMSVDALRKCEQGPLTYGFLCHEISRVVNKVSPKSSVFVDTGHLLSFSPAFYKTITPSFYHCGFFHCMGWSLPSALGAKVARPEHPAIALIGDGSYLFSSSSLATAFEQDIPVIAIALNNKSLQIEGELMERLYGRRAYTDYSKESTGEPWGPNLMTIAEAMGAQAKKVNAPEELSPAIHQALEANAPFVIDVEIDANAPGYRSVWYPYPNDFWISKDKLGKDF